MQNQENNQQAQDQEICFSFDLFNVSGEVDHISIQFDEKFEAEVTEAGRRC